jgi:hypothetical protein
MPKPPPQFGPQLKDLSEVSEDTQGRSPEALAGPDLGSRDGLAEDGGQGSCDTPGAVLGIHLGYHCQCYHLPF